MARPSRGKGRIYVATTLPLRLNVQLINGSLNRNVVPCPPADSNSMVP